MKVNYSEEELEQLRELASSVVEGQEFWIPGKFRYPHSWAESNVRFRNYLIGIAPGFDQAGHSHEYMVYYELEKIVDGVAVSRTPSPFALSYPLGIVWSHSEALKEEIRLLKEELEAREEEVLRGITVLAELKCDLDKLERLEESDD